MDDLKLKNQWPWMKSLIIWFVLIALLLGGLSWARIITLPVWLSFERRAFVASHQYIENKRAAIARYSAQCASLREGPQKTELRQRIAIEKALLPEDAKYGLGDC